MKKFIVALFVVGIASSAFAKAYFSPRDEMVEKADLIAIVKITEVKNLESGVIHSSQEATATVEKVLKGKKLDSLTFFVPCFYPCAITSVEKGRYLIFLKKEDEKTKKNPAGKSEKGKTKKYAYSDFNWHLSYRPIKDDKLSWYIGNKSLKQEEKTIDKVLSEVSSTIKKPDSPSPSKTVGLTPYKVGKEEANTALTQGKLCWKFCGQPAGHDNLFKKILKDEYKVDLLVVAGCRVTDDLLKNVKGYNEVMEVEILKRYKKDIVKIAEDKAKLQFENQRKK